ncbi:MAG: PAS domain S-box protein [Deltaproteobacteria bacterium]|nr:PAS domain S-box protein [Deltaproteobacteria bacterium]MBW1928134.1 PAS domain S-box protein [Deltaproteobacteria bacterium]MBW2025671.1 PAS domain S-box protein [Deltaproteobacteria bacterium]MBW2125645.1 PAS domain S-box protein [Deltaproteobacteria bacterium]
MSDKPTHEDLKKRISQLEQEVEELTKISERYRRLFEDASVPLYQTSSDGEILYVNSAVVRLLGFPDKESLMHVNAGDLEDPEVRRKMHEMLRRGEIVQGYETRVRRYDGSFIWVRDTSRAVFDSEGNILYFNGSLEDISERKRAEEEIQKRQKYLESVLESAPDAIITVDSSHRVIEWNPGAERIFGYTKEEARDRDLDELVARSDVMEEAKDFTKLVLCGKALNPVETVRYRKDGTRVDVIASGAPIMIGGQLEGVVAVYKDITERKRAERALQESEKRYRSLFERLPVGLFVTTPDGRFLDANPAFVKMVGCPDLETLLNTPVLSFYHIPEERTTWKRMMETQDEKVAIEFRMRRLDGSPIWVRESARAVRDETGQVVCYEGVMEDITEIKQAEQEKEQLQQRLIHAQRMEAIGTLAGGIAHNFNNLLMGIQGHISLMRLDMEPDHPCQENLKSMEQLIRSGSRLTSQLLGYARKGQFEIRPLHLNEIIKETAETFGSTRREIRIHLDLDKDLSGVQADQGQMEQMLLNLFVNAAEAMPGGGELFLKTRNVTEAAMKGRPYKPAPGNYVMITVTDTGIGMEKEVMDRIFEPFFTTKGFAKGTGLGLASVYGIVKGHKGYIDVFSEKGKGTRFEIFIPASKQEGALRRADVKIGDISKGHGTILLVDDEEFIIQVGAKMLESLGYHVMVATSGKGALAIYEKEKDQVDLVILDLILPEMGGGQIYDRLKEINPKVKVLLSSGYTINGEASDIMARGCNGFIQKPFDLNELSQKLSAILES